MNTEKLETIKVGIDEGIIRVVLSRPERRNAVNLELGAEISYAIKRYAYRSDAKVLIFSAEGKSFSAGNDLKRPWQASAPRDRLLEYSEYQQMFVDIENAPVVKIAQVHGHAVGAGLVLPMLCDLRYGTPDVSLRLSELELGVPFSMGAFPRLVRMIGLTRTADMVLTGRAMLAEEALSSGYFTAVVAEDQIEDHVLTVAQEVAKRSPLTLMETLRQIRETAQDLVPGHRNELMALMAANLDPESREVGSIFGARFTKPTLRV
jgi:enoyl-CoA hydratase/carnithine racemase